ncbi:MAG: DUF1302 domain-containing protein [Pseudomonas sp.]
MKVRDDRVGCANFANLSAIGLAVMFAQLAPSQAMAFVFEVGNPDIQARWDNTVKYSSAFRVEGRSSDLITDDASDNRNTINLDDGDRNFSKGLISNRFDLLSELDISYKNYVGMRVSGAGWYDTVYNQDNDNNDASRVNHTSAPADEFTDSTRDLHGRDAELLDAFVYINSDIAGRPANARLGRHTLLYGETLFFGANGIAYAQAPVDIVKALSVPNSQFKEVILPVNQLSGQVQLTDTLTLGGYYQLEFRKSRLPGVGSYFSPADVLGAGAENFVLAPGFGVPRTSDEDARDDGQYGLQLRWRPESMDTEFGIYALRYHDKSPQAYLRPLGAFPGSPLPFNFQRVYPEDIKTYGVSFSTTVGDFNVAGEASVRRDTPLVSGPEVDLSLDGSAGIGSKAKYAVGNSAHANLSTVYFLPPSALWDGGSLLGEVAWNRRTSITKNAEALDPNSSRDAWGMRFVVEPSWFQVFPQFDISMPLGVGYNPHGNSSVVGQFNGGTKRGGDVSIGLKGSYQHKYNVGLNYTHFYGDTGAALGADGNYTFKQSLGDRDFVSLSLQTTF